MTEPAWPPPPTPRLEGEALTAAAGWCAPSGAMSGIRPYWSAPVTRLDVLTDDHRILMSSGFTTRSLPMPVLFQKAKSQSHQGAVVVGRVLGTRIVEGNVTAWGDWMDPDIIPEVRQAYALAESGVNGMSVDPGGFTLEVDESGPEPIVRMTSYQMAAVTLVPIAAFDALRVTMSDTPYEDYLPGGFLAAGGPEATHTGAMIALVPSEADAERLAVPGGEPVGELHTTLYFLGKADDFSPASREHLIRLVRDHVGNLEPVNGEGFAVSVFNPGDSEKETCIVLGVGGDEVMRPHRAVLAAIADHGADLPKQHVPYVPHVTLIYTDDASKVEGLVDRVGPITFDKVRVAFGDDVTDIPLGSEVAGAAEMPKTKTAVDGDVATHDTGSGEFAVSSAPGWEGLPIADRKQPFDADDAILRILAWAQDDASKAHRMFLWRDPKAAQGTREAYRLPIGDIINGRPTLVYHAVYAGAALINGAHGGLPGLSAQDKSSLRSTMTRMYAAMARAFRDPGMKAPWDNPVLVKANMGVDSDEAALTAAGALNIPADAFTDPGLTELTRMTVEDRGEGFLRVFGHVAAAGVCHTGIPDVCTTVPRSASKYAGFHRYSTTADGTKLPVDVGRITGGYGAKIGSCSCCPGIDDHACTTKSFGAAVAHYDDLRTLAYGRAGEDAAGHVWFAGIVAPEADDRDRAELSRKEFSGDWREYAGNLELAEVLELAMEPPGFPLPHASVSGGRQLSLVAAGVIHAPAVDLEAANRRLERLASLHTVDQFERGQRLERIRAGG